MRLGETLGPAQSSSDSSESVSFGDLMQELQGLEEKVVATLGSLVLLLAAVIKDLAAVQRVHGHRAEREVVGHEREGVGRRDAGDVLQQVTRCFSHHIAGFPTSMSRTAPKSVI